MEVSTWAYDLNNETTATWQYRFRRLIDRLGNEWIQVANSNGTAGNFTYGNWMKTLSSSTVSATELDKLAGIESNVQDQLDYIDRIKPSMILDGTTIPANADLNSVTYLKVGHFNCWDDDNTPTLINCPTTKPFSMEVYSPFQSAIDNESTQTYVRRIRKIIDTNGDEWIQQTNSGSTAGTFTYGAWKQLSTHGSNYGICSTAAATAEKTVTINNSGFRLETGVQVIIKFTNANSIASPTLNVNNTGAKPIYRYGTTAASTGTTTTGWVAGAVQTFTYDGTAWIRDYWYNTTYANTTLGQGYGTCATAAATVAKVVTLSSYALATGGIVSVKFTYDVPANATMNINSKGAKAIYYRGSAITAGVIRAGDTATFIYDGTYYHLIGVDRATFQYGTSELTAGTSALATGTIYIQYE